MPARPRPPRAAAVPARRRQPRPGTVVAAARRPQAPAAAVPAAGRPRRLLAAAAPLVAGGWLLWRVRAPRVVADDGRALSPERRPDAAPRLSVVIPARDEAASLPRLLASLAAQTRPVDEVVVVDDHSSDGTAALARAAGATVVDAPPLPDGWVGKTSACAHGAGVATGELLLFLDADVTLAPDAVARLLDEHRRAGGLVSVQPRHDTVAAYEQLSAVCNLVVMMGTGAFTGRPGRPAAMAFGPCLLVGRDDYDATGGHAHPSVRRQVAEDIALARRMRAIGRPVTVLAGGDVVAFRMYPGGPRAVADGWSKMLAGGAAATSPLVAAVVVVWVTGALLGAGRAVALLAGFARRGGARRDGAGRGADAAVYLAWAAEMTWLLRRVGRWRWWTGAAFPLPLLAFLAFLARSVVLVVGRRPATWRGRAVPAEGARAAG